MLGIDGLSGSDVRSDPTSFNKYVFAGDDPIDLTDASGQVPTWYWYVVGGLVVVTFSAFIGLAGIGAIAYLIEAAGLGTDAVSAGFITVGLIGSAASTVSAVAGAIWNYF